MAMLNQITIAHLFLNITQILIALCFLETCNFKLNKNTKKNQIK